MLRSFRRLYYELLLCVALITGFYLILTRRNLTPLEVLFGPASIKIVAENNTRCSGYGKSASSVDNKCEKRFPNALIIGAEKGGTSALLRFLSQHPQIVRREQELKELRFFCKHYSKGFQWYKEQMPYSLPGQIVIEKSVDYLMDENTPRRVFNFNPDIKIILAVRNPVERALSAYAMRKFEFEHINKTCEYMPEVRIGKPFPAFEKLWENLVSVLYLYDFGLENWLKYFSLGHIHILEHHQLVSLPVPELRKIEQFFNIDPYFDEKQFYYNSSKGFYCLKKQRFKSTTNCLPKGKGLQHPTVNTSLINKLKEIFRPHNKNFYQLSGKRFNWDD